MDAKDLRIGNWVTFKGSSRVNVKLDRFDLSAILYNEDEVLHYEPIQLTEEILLKCGFEKYGEYHDSYKNNPFIIELSILGEFYYFRKMINANESILLKEIKYLHQLQNIFKELTGKELEYNK